VAAAALLGAPLGHDFLTVSLSDLLTPWEVIEQRIRAAAESDLVLVIYNPRSAKRTWQIEKTRSILLEHRSPDTPVGIVTDAGRPGQSVVVTTLGGLDCEGVNMTTCVIVGSSTTRLLGGRMVTPRGYGR
jgi:cobalt-precorrin 5A hydrolase/precorrin-3B C17-methyltransferase